MSISVVVPEFWWLLFFKKKLNSWTSWCISSLSRWVLYVYFIRSSKSLSNTSEHDGSTPIWACRSAKYGCSKASLTVILSSGFIISIFDSRSNAFRLVSSGSFRLRPFGLFFRASIIVFPASWCTGKPSFSTGGHPRTFTIISNWWSGDFPCGWNKEIEKCDFCCDITTHEQVLIYLLTWKKGSRVIISARIQPTDQISTAFPYLLLSQSNSGALYHRVTTYSVKQLSTSPQTPLESPKSQRAKSQLALTRMFDGFKSRCTTFAEWIYFSPRSIWYRKYRLWWSDNGCCELTIWSRSLSISVHTMYKSCKSTWLCGYVIISNISITFSWLLKCKSNFISRSIRFAFISSSNIFVIFFIATLFPVFVSKADVTVPYEPFPISFRSEYLCCWSKDTYIYDYRH